MSAELQRHAPSELCKNCGCELRFRDQEDEVMDKKTEKALRASIRKWDLIAAGKAGSDGPNNCPLCKEFYANVDCKGCPVAEATRDSCCSGSPYDAWDALEKGNKRIDEATDQEFVESRLSVKIAIAEANFLRALLPRRGR